MTVKHLFPAVEPSLNLDFANSKKLDPRITFTRSSTGTYVDSNGLIKTAAANEARFDHDGATGSSLGLLVEESRTNLHIGSTTNALNQGIVGLTQGSTSTTDPTGSASTVETWTVDTSTGEHDGYHFYNNTYVDYTWSLFVKANGITRIQVSASQRDNTGYIEVNLVDGSTIGTPASNTTATPVGGGWVRISVSALAYRAHGVGFWLLDSNGNRSFTGNGTDGVYVWGIQLEQQAGATFPTSYIPTSGSTVTRSADVASITGTNFSSWYNQSEGSLLFEYTPSTAIKNKCIWQISGSASNQRLLVYNNPTGSPSLYSDNAGLSQIVLPTPTTGVKTRNAYAFSQSEISATVDGTTINTVSDTIATTMDKIEIGHSSVHFPLPSIDAHIARLTYYPYRLTDAQLEALTL